MMALTLTLTYMYFIMHTLRSRSIHVEWPLYVLTWETPTIVRALALQSALLLTCTCMTCVIKINSAVQLCRHTSDIRQLDFDFDT